MHEPVFIISDDPKLTIPLERTCSTLLPDRNKAIAKVSFVVRNMFDNKCQVASKSTAQYKGHSKNIMI